LLHGEPDGLPVVGAATATAAKLLQELPLRRLATLAFLARPVLDF
jgi:hypothetical protein